MEKFKEKRWINIVGYLTAICALLTFVGFAGVIITQKEFFLWLVCLCVPTILLFVIYTLSETKSEYTRKFLNYYWSREKECRTKEQFENLYQEIYNLAVEGNHYVLSFPLSIKELLNTISNKIEVLNLIENGN